MGLLDREHSGKKKGGGTSQMERKQGGHNGDEVTSVWKNID